MDRTILVWLRGSCDISRQTLLKFIPKITENSYISGEIPYKHKPFSQVSFLLVRYFTLVIWNFATNNFL